MKKWVVEFIPEALNDLEDLEKSNYLQVLKAIKKVLQNPLPDFQGGYGKPLGNKMGINLSGYMKIKLKKAGLRIIYSLVYENEIMKIIVISVRDDGKAYKLAEKRMGN